MLRDGSIEEISDGKFYGIDDLAKIGCNGCKGCSQCCRKMGRTAVLDPLDVYRLAKGLGTLPAGLFTEHEEAETGTNGRSIHPARLELNVVDGLILPNLALKGPQQVCSFLNDDGRCAIHDLRPGVCRLYPLGRYYDGSGDYTYIVQAGECPYPAKTKIKIRKWINEKNYQEYHAFVLKWHDYRKQMEKRVSDDPGKVKQVCMNLLQTFFLTPYPEDDFYREFDRRMDNEAER